MSRLSILLPGFLVTVCFLAACSPSVDTDQHVSPTAAPFPTATRASESNLPVTSAPIGKVDFKNLVYRGPDDYAEKFALRNGERPFIRRKQDGILLSRIEYCDLTGDDEDDAVIVMDVLTGGSATPNLVFIYTLKKDRPAPLWRFITGDRAEGGLKKVWCDNDELVVELFGENKLEKGVWNSSVPKEKYRGDGHPTLYTKTRLKWNGREFVTSGYPEVFDIEFNDKKQEN